MSERSASGLRSIGRVARFAHIGAEMLTEAGILIDMVSGSSMGSIIGGPLLRGMKMTYSTASRSRSRNSRNTGSST